VTHLKETIKYGLVVTLMLLSQLAWAISNELQSLVTMETQMNAAVSDRHAGMIPLRHYEIPLSLVESSVALRANPQFVNSLIFEKDGQKYLRWIINPEDTHWHKAVEDFLLKNNIQPEKKTYFEGYQTASRSYIVVDPNTGAEFSYKGSTDHTGGAWRDKKQTWDDAQQIRLMTDFVHSLLKNQPPLENTILLDEPMAFGIKDLDQGMVIRSYEDLSYQGKHYVPGFSIMHEKLGAELALKNGSKDPATYWNEHYNKPLARALAEFFALTGMAYDSPHSQNFLVELTADYKPTGKIVLRDFGDTYLSTEFFEAFKRTDILSKWDQGNVKKNAMSIRVGILHGNKPPSWISTVSDDKSNASYDQWGRDFFAEFNKEFKRQTGRKLTARLKTHMRGGLCVEQKYSLADKEGYRLMELVAKGAQRNHLLIRSCEKVFLAN